MVLMLTMALQAKAEGVNVKYWGTADLSTYDCQNTQSSFVHRICYDQTAAHVVVLLNQTYYAYCRVDPGTVSAWLAASSKGRFYNQRIKSGAVNGLFACN